MKNREVYHLSITAAEVFKRSALSVDEQDFWTGYLMGLRYWKQNALFHAKQENAQQTASITEQDYREMISCGYDIGAQGTRVHQAIQQLATIF